MMGFFSAKKNSFFFHFNEFFFLERFLIFFLLLLLQTFFDRNKETIVSWIMIQVVQIKSLAGNFSFDLDISLSLCVCLFFHSFSFFYQFKLSFNYKLFIDKLHQYVTFYWSDYHYSHCVCVCSCACMSVCFILKWDPDLFTFFVVVVLLVQIHIDWLFVRSIDRSINWSWW